MKTPPVTGINTVAKRITGRRDSVLERKNIRDALVSVAGLIGRPIRDETGRDIGKLVDIVVRHGETTYPPVSGLIVKVGNSTSFIDASSISKFTHDEIRLSSMKVNL